MPSIKIVLRSFFGLTYLLILFLVASSIDFHAICSENLFTFLFLCTKLLMYSGFYLAAAYAITHLIKMLLKPKLQQPNFYKIITKQWVCRWSDDIWNDYVIFLCKRQVVCFIWSVHQWLCIQFAIYTRGVNTLRWQCCDWC